MSKAFKCDRCGALYEMDAPEVGYAPQTHGFVVVATFRPDYFDNFDPQLHAGGKVSTQRVERRYELCEGCYRELCQFMGREVV